MALLVPAVLACAYHWFLALKALTLRSDRELIENSKLHTFKIIIPAHNEEAVIGDTLRSLTKISYPQNKYEIIVIADNCSDRTAEIAAQNNVACLERQNPDEKGKGFALAWAFEHIPPEGFDAILVLDADCLLDSHALNIFNHYLGEGHHVLQANHIISNPEASANSYALAVGSFIEKELFYSPKSSLGLAVLLQGTGMVFHKDVLQAEPWKAQSIVEDIEYALRLLQRGIQIKFVREARIVTETPVKKEQVKIQRTRWADGNLKLGKSHAFKMIFKGIASGNWLLVDAGWTFLILSRPLVLFQLFIVLTLAVISSSLLPGAISMVLVTMAIIIFLLETIYFALGIVLFGLNSRRLLLLLSTPIVVIKLIMISLISVLGINKDAWTRTPR